LLIDFQTGFDDPVWGVRNNPDAEANAAALLKAFRADRRAVYHVRHLSVSPESPLNPLNGGTDFKPGLGPLGSEPVFEKSVNSAFIGTTLEDALHADGITDLVIAGLTTPHCVSTSCRMAANLGFAVTLAHDACAAFDGNADMTWQPRAKPMTPDKIHISAIAHLHGEFVTAQATADILTQGV
jgi:nicotinamidase-related amidase